MLEWQFKSISADYEFHQTSKVIPLTLQNKDIVACIYYEQTQDIHVIFYPSLGPRNS